MNSFPRRFLSRKTEVENADIIFSKQCSFGDIFEEISTWDTPGCTTPSPVLQVGYCFNRYLLKRLRLRKMWYIMNVEVLVVGILMALLTGTPVTYKGSPLYLVGGLSVYSTLSATIGIATSRQGPEGELFAHEKSSGVNQWSEIIGRFLGDLVWWCLLPFLYGLPFASMTSLYNTMEFFGILWGLWWATSGIGYLFSVIVKQDTAVPVAAFTFIVSMFLNGQIGVRFGAPGSSVNAALSISPSRWAYAGVLLAHVTGQPFDQRRAEFTSFLVEYRYMPGLDGFYLTADQKSNMTAAEIRAEETILGQERLKAIMGYERFLDGGDNLKAHLQLCVDTLNATNRMTDHEEYISSILVDWDSTVPAYNWLADCMIGLFLIGLVLRVATAVGFYWQSDHPLDTLINIFASCCRCGWHSDFKSARAEHKVKQCMAEEESTLKRSKVEKMNKKSQAAKTGLAHEIMDALFALFHGHYSDAKHALHEVRSFQKAGTTATTATIGNPLSFHRSSR
uniref:ABC-2 type transporter transmembrane domain-containing protein n=1 Tax=Haptolina brevifila TaxID=156173 RepID=A0A7S2J8B7_9EUKA